MSPPKSAGKSEDVRTGAAKALLKRVPIFSNPL
jgi:hypothetical protein